ncbi:PLDc N-terminal domain-containing protein, partial [Kocuria oceani]
MSFSDFLWLLLIWTPLAVLWGVALADIFRRDDVSGGPKVLWTILVLLLPLLGTLIHLPTRSAGST